MSVILLLGGALSIVAGVFLLFGLGVALIVGGVFAIAADLLVPNR